MSKLTDGLMRGSALAVALAFTASCAAADSDSNRVEHANKPKGSASTVEEALERAGQGSDEASEQGLSQSPTFIPGRNVSEAFSTEEPDCDDQIVECDALEDDQAEESSFTSMIRDSLGRAEKMPHDNDEADSPPFIPDSDGVEP